MIQSHTAHPHQVPQIIFYGDFRRQPVPGANTLPGILVCK
jgi:hypothetical protein